MANSGAELLDLANYLINFADKNLKLEHKKIKQFKADFSKVRSAEMYLGDFLPILINECRKKIEEIKIKKDRDCLLLILSEKEAEFRRLIDSFIFEQKVLDQMGEDV